MLCVNRVSLYVRSLRNRGLRCTSGCRGLHLRNVPGDLLRNLNSISSRHTSAIISEPQCRCAANHDHCRNQYQPTCRMMSYGQPYLGCRGTIKPTVKLRGRGKEIIGDPPHPINIHGIALFHAFQPAVVSLPGSLSVASGRLGDHINQRTPLDPPRITDRIPRRNDTAFVTSRRNTHWMQRPDPGHHNILPTQQCIQDQPFHTVVYHLALLFFLLLGFTADGEAVCFGAGPPAAGSMA